MVLRVAADFLLLNLSLLLSLILRFVYVIVWEKPLGFTPEALLTEYMRGPLRASLILTLITLVIFALSGFYTYGRFYQGRYKVIMVFQAVSLSYLISGFLFYILARKIYLPRGVLLLSWILTLILLTLARIWSQIWRDLVSSEQQLGLGGTASRKRQILIIGGAGYIGSALVGQLLARGYRVRVLDLLIYGREPIMPFLEHPQFELKVADFRQVDTVVEAMNDIDAVVHLGAIVGDPACALNERLTIDINVMATRMIAEVAKGMGVYRFVFASTCSVYGASHEILDERSALHPVSLYARTKIASEHILSSLSTPRFAPTCLRFGTIYGLSGRTRFDLVVNLFVAKAIVDGEITVSGGDQWRPFVHVEDAAAAICLTLQSPLKTISGQSFNVGADDQNFTIMTVAELVRKHVPATRILVKPFSEERRNYRVTFGKIRKLGFAPQFKVEDGIVQVAQALTSGKVGDYRDVRYSNVKFLSEEGAFRLIQSQDGWAYALVNEPMPNASLELAKQDSCV